MIKHSVIFRFKKNITTENIKLFFKAAKKLSTIENVKNLEILAQTSPNNSFTHSISMEFDTTLAYENYNNHPQHQLFIKDFWIEMVDDFLEIDLEKLV